MPRARGVAVIAGPPAGVPVLAAGDDAVGPVAGLCVHVVPVRGVEDGGDPVQQDACDQAPGRAVHLCAPGAGDEHEPVQLLDAAAAGGHLLLGAVPGDRVLLRGVERAGVAGDAQVRAVAGALTGRGQRQVLHHGWCGVQEQLHCQQPGRCGLHVDLDGAPAARPRLRRVT